MESNAREISIEEIMQRIREEAARRKRANLSEEISMDKSVGPEVSETATITNETTANTRIDRFLWKYGTRYAKMINKIPVLKNISEKQYLRLVLKKTSADTLAMLLPSNDRGLNFLGINWYYHDFFEQTRKEGFKGRIKLFILRYIGFYAWWQGQINKVVYQELTRQGSEFFEANRRMENQLDQAMNGLRSELAERDKTTEKIKGTMEDIRETIEEIKTHTILDISQEIKGILRQVRDHKLSILDQQRRVALLLEEVRKKLGESLSIQQIENVLKEDDHLYDAVYLAFEDRFRGMREDIKERQKIYLPHIDDVKAGTEDAPILDIGCGRGEWLELLKEGNYVAKGIDINRASLQQCIELGLDVVEADAIEFLRKQKPNSFGAITGFHIIEHLSLKNLIALFDESLRVLKPGGIVIFETPNPTNLFVSMYDFYRDPSHIRPVHPDTVNFLLEMRGFIKTGTYFINDQPPFRFIKSTEWNLDDLNGYLNASRDFALIGYKG